MPNGDDPNMGPMTDSDEGGAAAPVMDMGEPDEDDFVRRTRRKPRKSPRPKFRATRKARRTRK